MRVLVVLLGLLLLAAFIDVNVSPMIDLLPIKSEYLKSALEELIETGGIRSVQYALRLAARWVSVLVGIFYAAKVFFKTRFVRENKESR